MVMIVIIMMVMLKISPLSEVMVSNGEYCNGYGSGYGGGDVEISPLGDVMVSDGECCNGVGGVYDVENLTTE